MTDFSKPTPPEPDPSSGAHRAGEPGSGGGTGAPQPGPGYSAPPPNQAPPYQPPPSYPPPNYPPPGQGFPPPPQAPGYQAPGAGYGEQGYYGGGQPPVPASGFPPAPPPYGGYPGGGLSLPPGVELASKGRRIGAYFLAFPLLVVTLVIGYLIWGGVLWGKGTSPALRVLGMRCVDANTGQPVGFGKMALRDIVGGIAQGILSIITALVSFVLFLSTEKRQSLCDLIGSTVVVYDPNKVFDGNHA